MQLSRRLSGLRYRLAALSALAVLTGCNSFLDTVTAVRGKVSYHGVPLQTGTIVFTPDEQRGTAGPLARAEIRADGTYELGSDATPIPPAGWYRVTIVAMEAWTGNDAAGGYSVPRSLLPDKYRDPELSGLSCEFKAGEDNILNFDLD